MRYPVETFTAEEQAVLRPHFTNLDRPVFCLVNLPETVKGALFARYSRYPGTLRRLFLEEFADDVPSGERPFDGIEGERAAGLYERVFMGYGDDSIAQVGGAHVACEWVSNVLTKVLQRGRLAAYLEQSTRYIPYDQPIPAGDGGFRYYRDERLGEPYRAAMDEVFALYSRGLEEGPIVGRRAMAASRRARSGMEAFHSGQGARPDARAAPCGDPEPRGHLRLRAGLRAAPAAHGGLTPSRGARVRGMILEELAKVIPSFVARVERPDRGGEWIAYLRARREAGERAAARLGLDRPTAGDAPSVELIEVQGGEEELLTASLFESSAAAEAEIRRRIGTMDPMERGELIAELAGDRANRRHRPGRGWEAVRYRFEIVSDYGGFRDLQRHRMLTCQWQRLGPHLGAGIPEEIREAGFGPDYERALDSREPSSSVSRVRGCSTPRPTRSALATGFATCST